MEEQPEDHSRVLFLSISMIVVIIIVGVCAFLGYMLGENKVAQPKAQSISPLVSPVISQSNLQIPEAASNTSANWTIYTDVDFSIKYPTTWLVKKGFSTKEDVIVYDPKSIKAITQNGVQNRIPTSFVDILSVTASTQSAAQLFEAYKTQASSSASTSEQSPTLGADMVLVHSENSSSNTVLWSHNGLVAQFETSIQHLHETSTENSILQTFQFLK